MINGLLKVTLKKTMQQTTAHFRENKTYSIYESPARQTIHMECQALFSLKNEGAVLTNSINTVSYPTS